MSEGIWFSALLGAGIGILYSAIAFWLGRIAMGTSERTFLTIVMGGMVARIFVTIIILTIIVLFVPISKLAFLIGFFAIFMLGLIVEITVLHRRQNALSDSSSD